MRFCEAPNCKYPVFSTDKITRKGYCKSCANKFRTDLDRRTIIQRAIAKQKALGTKVRSLADSSANKEMLLEKGKIVDTELELWFKIKMNLNEPKCVECGAYKPELKQWPKGWRSCQAHILPKRHFKSIRTHPLAGIVLGSGFSGLCMCHDIYDSSWDKASKMNIWSEVVRRFKILYPMIKPEEHQFIPQVLLDTLFQMEPVSNPIGADNQKQDYKD